MNLTYRPDDQIQKKQKNEMRGNEKILEWISSSIVRLKHLDVISRRSPSTGEWLLKNDEFQAWLLGNSPPCLWCFGIRKCVEKKVYLKELTS